MEKVPFRGYWNIKYVAVRCDFVSSGCEVSAPKKRNEPGEGSREQVSWRVDERTGVV